MSEKELYDLYEFFSGKKNFPLEEFLTSVNEDKELKRMLEDLKRLVGQETKPNSDRIWFEVKQAVVARQKKRRLLYWSGIAAVIMVILLTGIMFLIYPGKIEPDKQLATIVNNKSQVRLLLSTGNIIHLPDLDRDSSIVEGGSCIQLQDSGKLTYTKGKTTPKETVFNTLQIPKGNEFRVVLSDGTEVWLNSDSELRYPVNFSDMERKVYLKGEGYFQVKRDTNRPFLVMAEEMEVEVLGTCFNVNTYRDNGYLTATLVCGQVKVRDTISRTCVLLSPDQEAVLLGDHIQVNSVEASEVVAWVNGQFLYTKMPLEQIARQMERWFNVQISFQDNELRSLLFTGGMKRYYTLKSFCSLIEETADVRFDIDGRQVTVVHAEKNW